MAKNDVPLGVSANLRTLFEAAKPPELTPRQWCLKGKVSTSFFTDLTNGREPGIDKVERMAGAIGLSLSEFLSGQSPPIRITPDAMELEAMLSEIVADEVTLQTRPADLPRIFATALHEQLEHYRSGLETPVQTEAKSARDKGVQSRAPTRRSARAGLRRP